ncbi:CBS domain-containing protein [Actinoplanes sp. NPDC020271]|uniref:restriction system modified-DNA reader domain-containing protein n=1 Tax=Actinoplanes sp. NPDC020271 TaxID=3363896 RepID=UPI0037A2DE8C
MVTTEEDQPVTRSMHLMDGRRVTLSDLIEAGLLKVGEQVRFTRPRMKASYIAEITETGRLRLHDGLEYRSPSRAAMVAANMRAVDGWHAWLLESTGNSLDALRQELLDQAVATSAMHDRPHDSDESATRLHEWLRSARIRAEGDVPDRVSVRELLSQWGARDRGDHIARIEADLANHGLATRPNFRGVTLDSEIAIITAAQEAEKEEVSEEAADTARVLSDDLDDSAERYIGLMIGNLPSALNGVASVAPTASMQEAMTKMLLNDYSQLAILSGKHTLRGAVTWQSIARARHINADATLADATEEARDVDYRTDLLEVLTDLQKRGFLFVRNESNAVAGIVTAADVAGRYGTMANPFILIGDLDRLLRRAIARVIPLLDVTALCDPQGRRITGYHDMAMGDYQRVLENPALWARMGWDLDQKAFVSRLAEIRKIRNDVMHFNPDPIPVNAVEQLRTINGVLRQYTG